MSKLGRLYTVRLQFFSTPLNAAALNFFETAGGGFDKQRPPRARQDRRMVSKHLRIANVEYFDAPRQAQSFKCAW